MLSVLLTALITANFLGNVMSTNVEDNKDNATILLRSLVDVVRSNLSLVTSNAEELAQNITNYGNYLVNNSVAQMDELELIFSKVLNFLKSQARYLHVDVKNCTDDMLDQIELLHDVYIDSMNKHCGVEWVHNSTQNFVNTLNDTVRTELEDYYNKFNNCADTDQHCFRQLSKAISEAIIDFPRNITQQGNQYAVEMNLAQEDLVHCMQDPVNEYELRIYRLLVGVDQCIYGTNILLLNNI